MTVVLRKITGLMVMITLLTMSLAQMVSPAAAQDFDRHKMLVNITNQVILPLHQTLVDESLALEETAHAFQANPNAETLEALQSAWTQTNLAWQQCILFEFGRLILYHTPISKLPTSIENVEYYLTGDEVLDESFIDSIGSNAKGLSAIEYFIYDTSHGDVLETLTTDSRRMAYLVALAENLHVRAEVLYDAWSPDGENYAGSFIDADGEGEELQESISMLNNQMVVILEGILHMRMGKPLGQEDGGEAQPHRVESPYSQTSIPQIISTLEGMQLVFNGGDDLGFDDYLDYLDAEYEGETLSSAINAHFENAVAALDAIEEPLDVAVVNHPEQVQAAYDAVLALMVLVRVDMAGQLGVTITFSDSDGD